jgi:hypothetical protein
VSLEGVALSTPAFIMDTTARVPPITRVLTGRADYDNFGAADLCLMLTYARASKKCWSKI